MKSAQLSTKKLLQSINKKIKKIEREFESTLSYKENYFSHYLPINSEKVFFVSTEHLLQSINTKLEQVELEIEITQSYRF